MLGSTAVSVPHQEPACRWQRKTAQPKRRHRPGSSHRHLAPDSPDPLARLARTAWSGREGFKENRCRSICKFFKGLGGGQWWLRKTLDQHDHGTCSQERCRVSSSRLFALAQKCIQSKPKSTRMQSKHQFPELHLNTWCYALLEKICRWRSETIQLLPSLQKLRHLYAPKHCGPSS